MFKRYRFVVALVLCLCVFAYDTVSISSDLGGRSFAWADEPAFNGNNVVLSDKLGLYFYLKDAVNGGKMTFKINGKTQTLTFNGNAVEGGSIIKADDNSWGFRCDTTSIEMADTIEATFTYNTNGKVENNGDGAIKSVKDYLDALVQKYPENNNNGNNTKLNELVKAIRDYGHYAQLALDGTSEQYGTHIAMEKASTITTTEITGETVVPAPKKDGADRKLSDYAITVSDNDKKSHVSYALDLDSNTALHVYLDPTICPSGATVSAKVQKVTETESGTIARSEYATAVNVENNAMTQTTETISNTTYTVLSFSDISAHEIDNIYTITITTKTSGSGEGTGAGDGGEGNDNETTITISPLSYVYAVLKLSYTADLATKMGIDSEAELNELKQAVIAFYNYYAKTIAYRTSTEYSTAQ